jgi:GNAT superfamily N-acetyltransferase
MLSPALSAPPAPEAPPVVVRPLAADEALARHAETGALLKAVVDDGASVSFMAGFTRDAADAFYRKVAEGVAEGSRVLLVAEQAGRLLGTVQVVASGIANQPHRADVAKMLVHPQARGAGIGAALLAAAEREAAARGWWLLVLDTVVDSAGDRLYARGGWTKVGIIPDYALWPDGRLCPTRYYFKDLRGPVTIARETPDQPDVRALLVAAHGYSAALYPAGSNHMLPVAELLKPAMRFFVARRAGAAIGCGAVVINADGTGELKSFFVTPAARGGGTGAGLIAAAESAARAGGVRHLRLETGVFSAPALALYRRAGFTPCAAFAPYRPDPWSVFLEKRL